MRTVFQMRQAFMVCPWCRGQEALVLCAKSRKHGTPGFEQPDPWRWGQGPDMVSGCLQLDEMSARPFAEAVPGSLGVKSRCPCLQLCRH